MYDYQINNRYFAQVVDEIIKEVFSFGQQRKESTGKKKAQQGRDGRYRKDWLEFGYSIVQLTNMGRMYLK